MTDVFTAELAWAQVLYTGHCGSYSHHVQDMTPDYSQMLLVQSLWDVLLKLKFHRSDQQPLIMNFYFRKICVYI